MIPPWITHICIAVWAWQLTRHLIISVYMCVCVCGLLLYLLLANCAHWAWKIAFTPCGHLIIRHRLSHLDYPSPSPPLSLWLSGKLQRAAKLKWQQDRGRRRERERLLQQLPLLDTVLTDLRSFCCCCWTCKVSLACGAEAQGEEGGANFNFVATCDLSQHMMHTANFCRATTTTAKQKRLLNWPNACAQHFPPRHF